MRWLLRAVSLVLLLTLLCGISSGCGKDKSPTTAELMEKYGDGSYVSENEMPMVYLYGQEDEFLKNRLHNYNLNNKGKTDQQLRYILCNDLSLEQFGVKMQTQMMSGGEPDMILTRQSEMFADINKVIASGALAAWDEYEANWDSNLYYEKMLDGVYSPDGKHYLIPINVDMQFIVTTKSTLEKYGLTEDDFSDFFKTTETLYDLWQNAPDSVYPTLSRPDLTQVLSGVLDYEARKTALLQEPNLSMLQKWEEMFSLVQKRIEEHPLKARGTNFPHIMEGNVLLEFTDIDTLNYMISEYKQILAEENEFVLDNNSFPGFFPPEESDENDLFFEEKLSDLVILPLYDVNGKIIGNINGYALLSSRAKGKDALASFMEWMVEGHYCDNDGGDLGLQVPHINQASTMKEFWNFNNQGYTKGIFTGDILHEMIKDEEWNLRVPNATLTEYHDTITNYLYYPETADWEELERSINIYLSE